MTVASQSTACDGVIDLKCSQTPTDQGEKFWNSSAVTMKFSVEGQWLKKVRGAEGKPNYGMGNLDGLLEEVVGNKIELAGLLIDAYLKQLGVSMKNKLCRSKATGLMSPVTLFILWSIYRHILVLVRGYGGDVQCNSDGSKHYVTIGQMDTAMKIFSSVRLAGECVLAYQHFKRVPAETLGEKMVSQYNGRSVVAVTSTTPLCLDYNISKETVNLSFYVQRYTAGDFVVDATLQALMNQQIM